MSDELRRRALRRALEERLQEVRERVSPPAPAVEPAPADDPEELLRHVMVRLLPAVARVPADERSRAELVAHVRALHEPARGSDLRFLDAWNNAYESLGGDADAEFLAEYAALLESHAKRLASP